jgi:hypothetical protein
MKDKILTKDVYVTYHINKPHKDYTPIVVRCGTVYKAREVAADAHSLHGIGQVRIRYTKGWRKDAILITSDEHYQYKWDELNKQYFDKFFNPENF